MHVQRVSPAMLLIRAGLLLLLVCIFTTTVPVEAATWPVGTSRVQLPSRRVSGPTRFATSVAVAREAYPGWAGVQHVIVASGDDRAAADPLAASALCWAYDAPLLLVSARYTPPEVLAALREMVSANATVTVHVVGGTASVPAGRIADLGAAVGRANLEQPWPTGSRYDLARGIAARVRQIAVSSGRPIPPVAFLANGANSATFFDALSVSTVSAATGIPVLLVAANSVPSATQNALAEGRFEERVVVGGPMTVSGAAYAAARATARWHGATRYATAVAVAGNARTRGWCDGDTVGLVARIPDAVSGAALVGRRRGVMLVTETTRLRQEVADYLCDPGADVNECLVLGGTASLSPNLMSELSGAPALPRIDSPSGLVAKRARVSGSTGSNTTEVRLYSSSTLLGSRSVTPFGRYDFGVVAMPPDGSVLRVVSANPDGRETAATKTVRRLAYPRATSIVIDKSDFRLYWVRNDVLVKAYPIAIGRNGMETPVAAWRIGAKYYTSPGSVYGPRKMRLYRLVGSTYVHTAYNVHGTNQPWVIGTKASHGCIRLYNRDILELFPQVPMGTVVVTRR